MLRFAAADLHLLLRAAMLLTVSAALFPRAGPSPPNTIPPVAPVNTLTVGGVLLCAEGEDGKAETALLANDEARGTGLAHVLLLEAPESPGGVE